MAMLYFFVLALFCATSQVSSFATTDKPVPQNDNPNVWNFQIARKIIAAFQFNGMGMSIWEDQGVENTTVVSRRQFYVTPTTEFLPNLTQCEYNVLTGSNFVSYNIQVWNDRLQLAAMDRLKQMDIVVAPEQVQPLPFYQVRVIWNNIQQKLQKAALSPTWNSNLQQQSVHRFTIFVDDKATCQTIADTLKTQPQFFTDNIAFEYSLSAASTATRILTVKTEHFLNSQLMAALKGMTGQGPERYVTSDDSNRLTLEIMDNIVASQVVDGEYVPEPDQLTLKQIVDDALQLKDENTANFTQQLWGSVFWDPTYARPDKVTSYLNKILNINQGNHSINKSNQYSESSDDGIDFGIKDLFDVKGSSKGESRSSATYDEMYAWFLQHNYDVEIQGSIFVPKNLTLKRLNLGVLTRQETIYTKSVQMKHVDAPGTLKITVGSVNPLENEDIRKLREGLAAVTGRVSKVEPRIDALEALVINGTAERGEIKARIEAINNDLTAKLGTKVSACQLCFKLGFGGGRDAGCTALSNNPNWYLAQYQDEHIWQYSIRCAP